MKTFIRMLDNKIVKSHKNVFNAKGAIFIKSIIAIFILTFFITMTSCMVGLRNSPRDRQGVTSDRQGRHDRHDRDRRDRDDHHDRDDHRDNDEHHN